jgi:hypothetical protein
LLKYTPVAVRRGSYSRITCSPSWPNQCRCAGSQLHLAVGCGLGQPGRAGHGRQRPTRHAGTAGVGVEQCAGLGPMLQPLVLAGQGHVGVLRLLGVLEALAGMDQPADELLDLLGDAFAVGVGAGAQVDLLASRWSCLLCGCRLPV